MSEQTISGQTSIYDGLLQGLPKLPWHWRWKWVKWIHNGEIRRFEQMMKEPAQPPITHFLGMRIALDDGTPILPRRDVRIDSDEWPETLEEL